MNYWIVVFVLLLVNLVSSRILVVLPVADLDSLQGLLQKISLTSSYYQAIDILTCNEDSNEAALEEEVAIGYRYYSNILCDNYARHMTNTHESSHILEYFRQELLRPSIYIRNDIDVFLSAMVQSSVVIFDSNVLHFEFMSIIESLLEKRLVRIDMTSEFQINSTLQVWRLQGIRLYTTHTERLNYSSEYTSDLSKRVLSVIAAKANNDWKSGVFPDKECNCGRNAEANKESCYALDNDTLSSLDQLKVHPVSPHQMVHNQKKLLLCMVYTITPRHNNLKSILDTWGKKCDGFIAWSNVTDALISAVHIYNFRLEGHETYHTMWYKVISIWEMVMKSHLTLEYEYFYLCGDDVYVIVNNLRQYLTSDFMVRRSGGGQVPVYLGRKVPHNHYLSYATGGSGYVLNAKAVEQVTFMLQMKSHECFGDLRVSMEDLMMANCFLMTLGLEAMDTRDSRGNERFHLYNTSHLHNDSAKLNPFTAMMTNLKVGRSGYSEYSIVFHLMTPNDYMYCIHDYFESITPTLVTEKYLM